jgi:hypothetical protein
MSSASRSTAILERSEATQWDYAVLREHCRHPESLQEPLRERGREGWELVSMTEPQPNEYILVFKRPG